MNSPFANAYLSILDRLTTEVPALRYIEQDIKQLESYNVQPSVSWPCCLIDVSDFDFTELSGKTQHGTGTILIRIGYTPYSSAGNLAPADVREKALEYYEVEAAVYKALQGWAPEGCSRMLRRKAVTEQRNDEYIVRAMPFATSLTDRSAEPALITIPTPDPAINAHKAP